MPTEVARALVRAASRLVSTPAPPRTTLKRCAAVLQTYADRGVFSSLTHSTRNNTAHFQFYWLWRRPFRMTLSHNQLRFPALLRGVTSGSPLDAGVRSFLTALQAPSRPEHRRVDPRRLRIRYVNSRGTGSIAFHIARGSIESATREAIRTVHELLLSFLQMEHPAYLAEHFGRPED